jgi:hypothetical protein
MIPHFLTLRCPPMAGLEEPDANFVAGPSRLTAFAPQGEEVFGV